MKLDNDKLQIARINFTYVKGNMMSLSWKSIYLLSYSVRSLLADIAIWWSFLAEEVLHYWFCSGKLKGPTLISILLN